MNVLKKFGVICLCLLNACVISYAQNTEANKKETTNIILKAETQQYHTQFVPKTKSVANSSSNVTVTNNAANTTKNAKKVNEPKKSETNFASEMLGWLKEKYSSMVDVMPNQLSNVMLYSFIDDWYGTRYRMGGTSKKGIDCSAFTQSLYKYVFGVDIVRTACLQFNASTRIQDKSELREGDLVFFRVNTSRISHVGVYLCNNYFVHSASSKGVSIASLNNSYWSRYYAGGGRIVN
jgi:lipoprotein Spr